MNQNFVKKNNINFYHLQASDKNSRKVLFVHGAWGTSLWWENWMKIWTENNFDCWAIDLRGRNGSFGDIDLGSTTLDDYLSDIIEGALLIKPQIIIGHSMGALLSLKAAETLSLGALILISPAPLISLKSVINLKNVLPVWRSVLRSVKKEIIPYNQDTSSTTALYGLSDEDKNFIHSRSWSESGKALMEIFTGKISVNTGRIAMPRLVISGSNDRLVSPLSSFEMASYIKADYYSINGASHVPFIGNGNFRLAKTILSWLNNYL